jgi:hypothetical protein
MRFWSRIIIGAAITMTVAVSALALPGGLAYASTGNACTTYPAYGLTCVNITGTGLHIDSMKGWMRNNTGTSIPRLHIELSGPNGLIRNCSTFTAAAHSNSPNCIWSPNKPETGGHYCVTLWQYEGGTLYNKFGQDCVDVRS